MTYPANYAEWAMSPCCRRMETRKCPTLEGCSDDSPCARLESNDETPWLNVPLPPDK